MVKVVEWYAIYTKSRSEKKVAKRLEENGYTVYCPVRKEFKVWSDRKKKVEVPVFASYVFVACEEQERYKILGVPGVVNFVFWLGKPAVIRAQEIETIRQFLADYPDAASKPITVAKGQTVTVTTGQLQKKTGVVTEIRNSTLVVRLEGIGFELFAEVPKHNLQSFD